MLRCAVILAEDDNGTILATCPDVPEAATFGEDREDASLRAVDAIETAIQGRIADRESPSRLRRASRARIPTVAWTSRIRR
jgi:antitoxin HicB